MVMERWFKEENERKKEPKDKIKKGGLAVGQLKSKWEVLKGLGLDKRCQLAPECRQGEVCDYTHTHVHTHVRAGTNTCTHAHF